MTSCDRDGAQARPRPSRVLPVMTALTVDALDAGVGVGAAQDGAVEHAGQDDIVDVVALAPHEAGVLLAVHTAEANGVNGCLFECGHQAVTSSTAGWAAAQWVARTMFS
jgi:hypothetical protein